MIATAKGVRVRLGDQVVVDGVDLSIQVGERVALVGDSGCGKTTLCRAMLGLIPLTAGQLRIGGYDPHATPRHTLAPIAQMLFQRPAAMLHPGMTLRQLLVDSARHANAPLDRVVALADALDLTPRLDALPSTLSGGEQRRAGLARVLLFQPKLLVADEPTTGLDAHRKHALVKLLMADTHATLLVTHDHDLAARTCDRVLTMRQGRLC